MTAEAEKYKDLPYYIDFIEESDKTEVIEFVRSYFFPDEPLGKSLGVKQSEVFEEWAVENLGEHCSFKAVHKETGEIIGVRISALKERGAAPKKELKFTGKEQQLMTIVYNVLKNVDPFEKYPDVSSYLDAKILCVNTKYRGMGIAPRLMKRVFDFMLEKKISAIRVLCVSEFASRVMQKSGLRVIYKVDYTDIKDENGNPIPLPAEPHKAIVAYIKELKELEASTQ